MANFYEDLAGEAGSDISEVSDVNPGEMAKMLQGLDDMDDALFKSKKRTEPTSEKSSRKATSSQETSHKAEKLHVTFDAQNSNIPKKHMNTKKTRDEDFDWDDPLGDILSSDESIGKTKTPSKKQIGQKLHKEESVITDQGHVEENKTKDKLQKGKVIDLFGLEDTTDVSEKKKEKIIKTISTEKTSAEPRSLESYLDKKSPMKQDKPLASGQLDNVKSQASNAVITKKSTSMKTIAQRNADQVESDDLLMGLGLEAEKKSGHNLFGGRPSVSKSRSVTDDIFPSSEKNDLKKINQQETSTEGPVAFGNYAPSLTTSRESRRGVSRRETSSIGDPLGLFSPPTTPQRNQTADTNQKQASSLQTSTPRKKSMVDISHEDKSDWLGLSGSKAEASYLLSPEQKKIENKVSKPAHTEPVLQPHISVQNTSSLPEWLGGPAASSKQKKDETGRNAGPYTVAEEPSNVQILQQTVAPATEAGHLATAQGFALQAQTQMEQEAAYALRLQEQQLRAALQMRQHEAQLASVHERQRTLLQHQEQQMQQLLLQQTHRQQHLEQQLQLQQQRIADYMQALMAQPPTALPSLSPDVELPKVELPKVDNTAKEKGLESGDNCKKTTQGDTEAELTKKDTQLQLMKLQVALQQSELEKKALESTLENLQIKHKEEVQLMEDCYKRQLSIVEEAMIKRDERLKAENKRIETEYKDCLLKCQDQQATLIENHAQQLAVMHKDHLTDMQALKDQHNALLEHVRHIQHAETSAVKEASQNMVVLHSTVEQLGRNTDSLNDMQRRLEKQSGEQIELRELTLKAREAEVQAYKDNLTRQHESAEEERKKLLSLVEQLELQVAQQRSKAEEERYTMRQETIRLETRVEAFEREKERVKGELERERQHLEKARQLLLEEQKTVNMQLKEEKLSIAKDRARIQALTQLQGAAAASQEQVMQLKAEAEAALTVAKEATEQVETQKKVFRDQQRQMERERQRLQELEHTLTIQARELEVLTQTALATRNEGAEALASAVQVEERQKHQAADLQRQLNEVKEREQRLAEERKSMSQERMKMHRNREQKVCSSCKSSFVKSSFSVEPSQMIEMEPNKYIDPKKVILKLVAEKERDALLSNSQIFSSPK